MPTKEYAFPAVQKIIKKFGFKNLDAKRELKEAVDLLYANSTVDDAVLEQIVSKISTAVLIENEK